MGNTEGNSGDSDVGFMTLPPVPPPPAATAQSANRSKSRKLLGIAAAIIVPLVGVVSLVVPAVLDARQKDSSLSTLNVRGVEMTDAVQSAETIELTTEPDPYADALTVGEVNLHGG